MMIAGARCVWRGRKRLLGLAMFALVLGNAGSASAGSKRPDFSMIDPAWAYTQIDHDLRGGVGGSAWQALKRDFPEEYKVFIKSYVAALLTRQDPAPISGAFLQSHIASSMLLAPLAPSSNLARIQRAKVPIIESLAKSDVESCAAFAVGDASTVQNNIQRHLDDQSVWRAAEFEAALFDVTAAARIRPKSRRILEAHDIRILRAIASSLGDTSEEIDTMLSRIPDSQQDRCRIGVLFFRAIAATPDDTAAKFAFH
jgi:hypothetical protein